MTLSAVMKLLASLNILLMLYHKQGEGTVTISPPGIAPVCRGDQLELTCTTSGGLLEWAFAAISENAASRVYTKALSSATQDSTPLIINTTRFIFSRVLSSNDVLVTTLLITPVMVSLNGTEVNCTDVATSETVSTFIMIINENQIVDPNDIHISLRVMKRLFERHAVTVTLEWSQGNPLYSYYIDVIPSISVMFNGSTLSSVVLAMSYNIPYNVSILGAHLCGDNNITIFTQSFYYSSCGDPGTEIDAGNITIIGYHEPVIEGSAVAFICPPELYLVGSRTSVCTREGEWMPDPSKVACRGETESGEQSPLMLSQAENIALASAFVFLMTSALFFIIGFLCRHFCPREKLKMVPPLGPTIGQSQSTQQDQDAQELELKTNVAYENVPI